MNISQNNMQQLERLNGKRLVFSTDYDVIGSISVTKKENKISLKLGSVYTGLAAGQGTVADYTLTISNGRAVELKSEKGVPKRPPSCLSREFGLSVSKNESIDDFVKAVFSSIKDDTVDIKPLSQYLAIQPNKRKRPVIII